jgi:hypothetical protein
MNVTVGPSYRTARTHFQVPIALIALWSAGALVAWLSDLAPRIVADGPEPSSAATLVSEAALRAGRIMMLLVLVYVTLRSVAQFRGRRLGFAAPERTVGSAVRLFLWALLWVTASLLHFAISVGEGSGSPAVQPMRVLLVGTLGAAAAGTVWGVLRACTRAVRASDGRPAPKTVV